MGVGMLVSYGFWRMQLYRFDEKVNLLFKKILREQFEEKHRSKIV